MKWIAVTLLSFSLVGLIGCGGTGTPGGPGAKGSTDNKPVVGEAENTFTLNVPNLSTKIKQGEAKVVSISLRRGKNFDQDVTLKFDQLPQGVTIDPPSPAIKHNEEDAKLTVKATNDAAIGDFTVKVTGHPSKGADAANEFKVTVEKK